MAREQHRMLNGRNGCDCRIMLAPLASSEIANASIDQPAGASNPLSECDCRKRSAKHRCVRAAFPQESRAKRITKVDLKACAYAGRKSQCLRVGIRAPSDQSHCQALADAGINAQLAKSLAGHASEAAQEKCLRSSEKARALPEAARPQIDLANIVKRGRASIAR